MNESVLPVIINSNSLISTSSPNRFRYTFPSGSVEFKNSKVAVSNITIPYSWFNVLTQYDNNTFQIIIPNSSSTTTTFTITLPNGFYQASDLNNYLQEFFINNGLYLINSEGNYIYYMSIVTDPSYYAIALNVSPWPTSLPSGYSTPINWWAGGYSGLANQVPQFVITGSPSTFGTLVGFTAGTYPATATSSTNVTSISNQVPQVTEVTSVVLSSSLVNNKYSNPTNILYSFGIQNTTFGSNLVSAPAFPAFVDIQNGNYNTFDITFLDQNLNNLLMTDTNILVNLLIKTIS